jgi:16S rRNA (guanine1207-N2)-methyltransferase
MSNPAQALLLEYLHPNPKARILLLEGGDGWMASNAAALVMEGEVLSLTRDVREVLAAQNRLRDIPHANATSDVFPTTHGWDIVLFAIPKERRYIRSLLLAAWHALKPKGILLLAGPSKGGAKAAFKDAERLFGNSIILGYKKHQRAASFQKGLELPVPLPEAFRQNGIAPGTQNILCIQTSKGELKIETHPGIFSWESLDEGTALLLDHLQVKAGECVWDVGCGSGIMGLFAAKSGAEYVAMSDINLIAIDYANKNAAANKLQDRTDIFSADVLQPLPLDRPLPPFSLIISNPAFHQGRNVNKSMAEQLITQAVGHLAPNGRLMIVANRFLNYDQWMVSDFRNVRHRVKTNKYHIIEAYD